MSARVELRVTMELLSNAVFGSGFSIPGGEDIAVAVDGSGYPYLPGTAFKGLLRESLANWLAWSGEDEGAVDILMGESGWNGAADDRRVKLTALTPDAPPAEPEDCFAPRTFTQLENGVVKAGSLRTASCIRRGLHFSGLLACAEEDVPVLRDALACVKWAGAMRSRGFGRVRLSVEPAGAASGPRRGLSGAACIRYRLRAETPLIITDLSRSRGNNWETRGLIPGSSIRGMVLSELSRRDPDWFQAHRRELLSSGVRFSDAVPSVDGLEAIPSIQGFYENKEETDFQSVLKTGNITPGYKRAGLGSFCALEGDTVRFWSARTGGVTRIQRNVANGEDTHPFQTRHLEAGQAFTGYITLDRPALCEKISEVFAGTVWLGADRYEGYGKCEVTALEGVDAPGWIAAYGCRSQADVGTTLYLLALSPLTMLGPDGEPRGLDLPELGRQLKVNEVKSELCATSVTEYGGYNRTWQCREPAVPMYDRGSIFKLNCDQAPSLDALWALERTGLGIRTAEGFGQVLFLRPALFEGLRRKEPVKKGGRSAETAAARVRRAKYRWIMENAGRVYRDGLSRSQLGTIQALCEDAMGRGGNADVLYAFLEKNEKERGARHGARFVNISRLIHTVMGRPLSETIGVPCPDDPTARLELLCQLFNYSRRGKEAG